jgi:hypothetical protein
MGAAARRRFVENAVPDDLWSRPAREIELDASATAAEKDSRMEYLNTLSDDQLALLGCAVAFIVSATIMSLSYYVGPSRNNRPTIHKLPHVERMKQQQGEQRKAA